MNGITENDAFYQETKQWAGEYSDKLDALHLPKETKLLLDRHASEHIANGSRYRELANQLGFSDCAELLLGNPRFTQKYCNFQTYVLPIMLYLRAL